MTQDEGTFKGRDGLRIAYRTWSRTSPRAPRATVVLVHTLYDHSGRYDEFARALVHNGIDVWAADQRGHGLSEGQRGVIDSFEAAAADLQTLVGMARERSGDAPCFVVAHSVGAVTALLYAIDHQEELAGLVVTAPALDRDAAPAPIQAVIDRLFRTRLVARVSTRISGFRLDPYEVTSDPEQVEALRNDPLVPNGAVPLRTAAEMSRTVRGPVRGRLSELTLPLLIVHGEDDVTVAPQTAVALRDAVCSADLTLRLLPGMRHALYHERRVERRRFHDIVADWVGERAGVRQGWI